MQVNLLDVPVVFINLDSEADKRTATLELLVSLGFKTIARVSAQPAVEVYRNKVTAVAKSHLSALQVFPAPFIVVEDDVTLVDWKEMLSLPDAAEAVSLGNMQWAYTDRGWSDYPIVEPVSDYPHLRKVVNMVGGHAWLYLTQGFVEKMKEVCEKSASPSEPALAHDCRSSRELYPHTSTYVMSSPIFAQKGKYHEVTCLPVEEYQRRLVPGFNDFFEQKKTPA